MLTMTGMTVVISRIGSMAQTLQIAGGAYLIELGTRAWLDLRSPLQATSAPGGGGDGPSLCLGARRGILVCLSNPKARGSADAAQGTARASPSIR